MYVNRLRREISVKIVYYGPPYSGKTTNLERLYATIDRSHRSELTVMKDREDRTLFFDYLQFELGTIGGLTPRFNLYTVPGQVIYETTRRIVLRGADGVVFVADSSASRLKANADSWGQLMAHFKELRGSSDRFPILVQFNKRDREDALPIAVLQKALASNGYPFTEAVATRDVGTRETLRLAIQTILG